MIQQTRSDLCDLSSTDFGRRLPAERAQTVSPADYDGFIARANAVYAGMAASRMATADEIARVIYGAATDGTNRLRYFCGGDPGGLVKARREIHGIHARAFWLRKGTQIISASAERHGGCPQDYAAPTALRESSGGPPQSKTLAR